jgi:glycosyltransferase involved in cell wall biosynthesis
VVVGDGELKEELVAYAQSLGLSVSTAEAPNKEATVVFTGWMKDADRALAGMDVVCLTSFNEGTPVSLIEAQAAGRPIVSTRVGGIEDVVQEGITALLCASDDTEAFASHLGQLVGNPVKIHEMSGKGVDFVNSRFTYTRLVEDTRRLYLQCLEDNSPA